MAAILESTEEDNYNHDETVTDKMLAKGGGKEAEEDVPQFLFQDKLSSEEVVKMLAKGGGKEAEEDAAQFLFAYNVALSAAQQFMRK
jgi:hypothetical protein